MEKKINRCVKCALPETYPGIKLNENNICNYCIYFEVAKDKREKVKAGIKEIFIEIIDEAKKKKAKYDCVVAYSGGKDSSFLLYILKEKFGLKILAHTLDNGFLSYRATENIKKIIKNLGIPHIYFKPSEEILRKIFTHVLKNKTAYPKEILAMMSPLCTACQGIILGTTVKLAIREKIPLVFTGYTPGQCPDIGFENFLKVKSNIYFSSVVYKDDPLDLPKIIRDPIDEICGDEIEDLYFKSQYIENEESFPKILFPYHALEDYDEKKIYSKLVKLGWKRPEDTDPCSTNCLLNTLSNYVSIKQYGYHPYIGELSFLIREGKMSYEEAIKAEKIDESSYAMRYSLKKLGLTKKEIEH
jgi:hypothetical protein